jgi:hypothetical protein
MLQWEEKGCDVCRQTWQRGGLLPEIAVNVEQHSILRRCGACGIYWEEFERFADVVSREDAERIYKIILPRE